MRLGGILPQAAADEYEMYEKNRTLRVFVNAVKVQKTFKDDILLESYSFGRIRLFPCRGCTGAFLTHVFLHELQYTWLHQCHESLYEALETCDMSEVFADESFRLPGGDCSGRTNRFPRPQRTIQLRHCPRQYRFPTSICCRQNPLSASPGVFRTTTKDPVPCFATRRTRHRYP